MGCGMGRGFHVILRCMWRCASNGWGELRGALHALLQPGSLPLVVVQSMCFRPSRSGHCNGSGMASALWEVEHRDMWEQILCKQAGEQVQLMWVPSNLNVEGNTEADGLTQLGDVVLLVVLVLLGVLPNLEAYPGHEATCQIVRTASVRGQPLVVPPLVVHPLLPLENKDKRMWVQHRRHSPTRLNTVEYINRESVFSCICVICGTH